MQKVDAFGPDPELYVPEADERPPGERSPDAQPDQNENRILSKLSTMLDVSISRPKSELG